MKCETVKGDTAIIKAVDEAEGTCLAALIEVDARNDREKTLAAQKNKISEMKAEMLEVIGKGEAQVANVMQSRRKYDYLNSKLDVIRAFRDNKNAKIFGDNQDDVISQMAAYRISNGQGGII